MDPASPSRSVFFAKTAPSDSRTHLQTTPNPPRPNSPLSLNLVMLTNSLSHSKALPLMDRLRKWHEPRARPMPLPRCRLNRSDGALRKRCDREFPTLRGSYQTRLDCRS